MKAIRSREFVIMLLAAGLLCVASATSDAQIFKSPPPGSVYRDYGFAFDWMSYRVTTQEAADNYPDRVYDPNTNPYGDIILPNPQLPLDGISTANAIRAEMVVTLWGGHTGTSPKWFTFNGTRVDIPELQTTPTDGQCYQSQYNVTVDIPVSELQANNVVQGDAGTQTCHGFGWPQWVWYGVILRVYYDPGSVTHPEGQITSPGSGSSFGENPTVSVSTSGGVGSNRVDVLAYYDGYDTDGDGVFAEYHHDYHSIDENLGPQIRNHVGTATGSGPSFDVPWNTSWVPDQPSGSVKLVARIRGTNNVWYVTDEVTGLTFSRQSGSVKLYKPVDVPERFWARDDGEISSGVNIATLTDATDALFLVRTWNGADGGAPSPGPYTRVNGWYAPGYGADHYYSLDRISMSAGELSTGNNTIAFYSPSVSVHGIEIMWPGPAVMVRYGGVVNPPLPGQPVLVSPASGATDQSVDVLLDWNAASDASSYQLQVATDNVFNDIVFDQSSIGGTSKQMSSLAGSTTFYWRVRAANITGNGPWSETWSFATAVAVPAQVSLVSPADNAQDVSITPTLRWRTTAGASSYHLQVSDDQNFGTTLVDESSLADTLYQPAALSEGQTYYWRVAGANAGGDGPWSATRSFTTTVTAPSQVTLVSPADNAQDVSLTPTLRWRTTAEATSYHLQVSEDQNFGSTLVDESSLADTLHQIGPLAEGQTHYWRVAGTNAGGSGPWSATRSFTTQLAVPQQVTLDEPAGGASVTSPVVPLKWFAAAGTVSKYWIEYAENAGFSPKTVDSTAGDTTYTLTGLQDGKTYHWRVRAGNAAGWGPLSAARTFSVVLTDVKSASVLPREFVLEQNYPNPFNPTTEIRYGLPKEGSVVLEVYSLVGELVAKLVDGRQAAGYHSVRFNAQAMPSGIYLYRLKANEVSLVKKMILTK